MFYPFFFYVLAVANSPTFGGTPIIPFDDLPSCLAALPAIRDDVLATLRLPSDKVIFTFIGCSFHVAEPV